MTLIRAVSLIGALVISFAHDAQSAPDRRFRIEELQPPASLESACQSGYAAQSYAVSLNDSGVAQAGFNCYTLADPQTGSYVQMSNPWIAASWFGSQALPLDGPYCCSWAQSINNRGQIFGAENLGPDGLVGTIWTIGGVKEHVFDQASCSFRISAATGGNTRYTVGWGYRPSPTFPFPDTCFTQQWVFRTAAGEEILGPLNGAPTGINASDVAVGTVDRSAVTYHVPTAQMRVLRAADDTHSIFTTDINDLGEAAGWIASDGGVGDSCTPGSALRWSRSGAETALPHLPGASSSRPWAVGNDGQTVGQSGEGHYCFDLDAGNDRAVLWIGSRALDMNTLIPRHARVTLTVATAINRRGEILATGYRNDEPLSLCVVFNPDLQAVQEVPCHRTRVYLLRPMSRR
jgi:uncharacterized membrane protein